MQICEIARGETAIVLCKAHRKIFLDWVLPYVCVNGDVRKYSVANSSGVGVDIILWRKMESEICEN